VIDRAGAFAVGVKRRPWPTQLLLGSILGFAEGCSWPVVAAGATRHAHERFLRSLAYRWCNLARGLRENPQRAKHKRRGLHRFGESLEFWGARTDDGRGASGRHQIRSAMALARSGRRSLGGGFRAAAPACAWARSGPVVQPD